MNMQFPLVFDPVQGSTLDNFIPGDNSQAVLQIKKSTTTHDGTYIFLWGSEDSGKSHLISAAAKAANGNDLTVAYIPLTSAPELTPEILDNIEQMDLICLDDIHTIAGDPTWEEALFHLFNRSTENSTNLLITANCSPSQLQIALPDLVSRLSSGMSYRLTPLNDDAKLKLLVEQAKKHGM